VPGEALRARVAHDLATPLPPVVAAAAAELAQAAGAVAVLFYGSVLRTGRLDDVLDFYVLVDRAAGSPIRRVATGLLWPDVGWRELAVGGRTIRAKIATMELATFERAATGALVDTTIWTRFAQPAAIAWVRGPADQTRVVAAVGTAIATAARYAAALGAARGSAREYWLALFAQTYRAEFRVERADRSAEIVDHAPDRYAALLPLAWDAAAIAFIQADGRYAPQLAPAERRRLLAGWRRRARAGKPLNVARLVKAAFTFDGAARYGLYKIERHTGIHVPLTRWRERHPVLAAPGVLWRVFRARAS